MKKILDELQDIDRCKVRTAILAGAEKGTFIGVAVVALGLLYCGAMVMVMCYEALNKIEWTIRIGLTVLQMVLAIYYAFAYCKNDSAYGLMCRGFSTGVLKWDRTLRWCAKMAMMTYAMTGVAFTVFFAFWPVLVENLLLAFLWIVLTVPAVAFFRICQNEINALYADERRAEDEFESRLLDDEDGEP